ncbi:DNA-directed RNA polymerase subunit beta', partial [Dissostichus eleginoides]
MDSQIDIDAYTSSVRQLLKARDTAFRSGDAQDYRLARAELKRGIKRAKHCHKLKIEEHFNTSDPRRMWQGLQTITDLKPTRASPPSTDPSLPDELNYFYARFDRVNHKVATRATLPADHLPLTLSPTDVRAELSRTNT